MNDGDATPSLTTDEVARALLVGAHGHGTWHLRNLRRLADLRAVDLIGVCDPRPPSGEIARLAGDARWAPVPGDLIDLCRPDVVVVATPMHTHVELASLAMRAGADVLLEKPPAPSMADFDRLGAVVADTARACQIGFQSFGSRAVEHVRALVADQQIGAVRGIGVAGAWLRTVDYWRRSPWAGRRSLDGVPVSDGVVTNPLAHALAVALRIDGSDREGQIARIETELHRANEIEADDTSCVRITTNRGTTIAAGLTLCAAEHHDPYVVVHGTAGRIVLWYTRHVVELVTDSVTSTEHPVDDLLENLLQHRRVPSCELIAPLERTAAFTEVVEAVRLADAPAEIAAEHVSWHGEAGGRHPVVNGVHDLTDAVAETLRTFSELNAPWTHPPATPSARPGGQRDELGALALGETVVATYRSAAGLDAALSPRPYLHPVSTLDGVVVTDAMPADHRWQLGVSVAIQDVGGTNFWGGRTYVRDQGYVWRGDHGQVRHESWDRLDADGFAERLTWNGADGRRLLTERREVRSAPRLGGWVLDLTFTLTDATGNGLVLGSPGTNGRVGGGYGGFFWRLPASSQVAVWNAAGDAGEEAVHGRPAAWLAWTGRVCGGRSYSLVVLGRDPETAADPWFVRVADYPGIGSALAFSEPVRLGPHGSVTRSLSVAILDGTLAAGQPELVYAGVVPADQDAP